ncbi:MAG: D-alanyl-D-alanine dipeptidase [Candidatus Midichloriaceae bacterium]|jgi:D-alanyl-D-alanine dipeptidase
MSYLPNSFVYLKDVAPEILVDIKYSTKDNFTGDTVIGYQKNICIITEKAANLLKNINRELNNYGLALKIFDAYRPKKAAKFFVDWSLSEEEDLQIKKVYYPNIHKKDIIKSYIAKNGLSTHSRGSTVDLTLINQETKETLDMGTIFDFFDETANTQNNSISSYAKSTRIILLNIMEKYGFKNLWSEWWHFTLIEEPHKDTYFDFDIK